jgi:hypothetical protein
VGHGRGDRPDADPLADVELLRELDDVGREAAPLEVRLGAGEDEDVARRLFGAELAPGQPTLGLAVPVLSVGRRAR